MRSRSCQRLCTSITRVEDRGMRGDDEYTRAGMQGGGDDSRVPGAQDRFVLRPGTRDQ